VRRCQFLINTVRFNSNNITPNRFNDLDLQVYFNDGIRSIQNMIVQSNPRHEIFSEEVKIPTVAAQEEYDLPADIFATSAINFVDFRTGTSSDRWYPARSIINPERRSGYGYVIRGDKILVVPVPAQNGIAEMRLTYVRKLYDLGPRFGDISSVGASDIAFTSLQPSELKIIDNYDYLSVVDKYGVFKSEKIEIDGEAVVGAQHTITTTSDLTGVTNTDFVVAGERTSTHCELPDVCELILTSFVERMVQGVDSSEDLQAVAALTNEERSAISELFKDVPQDPPYPPIISDDYLNI